MNKNQMNSRKKMIFNNNVLNLVNSNFILSNEFPIEMKASVLVNLYSKDYLKKYHDKLFNFVKINTKNAFDNSLCLTNGILKSLLVYNSDFIDFDRKSFFERIGVYLFLHQDYSTLIILTSRLQDDFLTKLVKCIDDVSLSLSDQFGKGLILQSYKR